MTSLALLEKCSVDTTQKVYIVFKFYKYSLFKTDDRNIYGMLAMRY